MFYKIVSNVWESPWISITLYNHINARTWRVEYEPFTRLPLEGGLWVSDDLRGDSSITTGMWCYSYRADSITDRKQQEKVTGTKVAVSSLPLPSVSNSGTDSVSCLWRSHTFPWILLHYLISATPKTDVHWNWLCYIETKSFVLQLMLFSCSIEIKFNLHCLCNGPLFRGLL